jgi:hypothetical protein
VRANYEQLPMGSREIIPARHFCHRFCDAGHSVCADPLISSAADAKKATDSRRDDCAKIALKIPIGQ